jgi:predicted CoA-substrate-specific enzyme activase
MHTGLHFGLDVGSGTAKGVVLDERGELLYSRYEPTKGHPLRMAHTIMQDVEDAFGGGSLASMTCTGTGGKNIAPLLGVPFVNEVICHAKAVEYLHPEARTIIDIGGEDAKLIMVRTGDDGSFYIQDFALNTVCAAGTGAFLEQQAARLGYDIQEFSRLAEEAAHIPSIAGRCTVFAKSDMIHLQQNGMADDQIIAGLCFAIVRNLKTNIAKGKKILPPLVFQGGVAANFGVRRAMRELLLSRDEDLVIPEHFKVMGGFGAALEGIRGNSAVRFPGAAALEPYLARDMEDEDRMPALSRRGAGRGEEGARAGRLVEAEPVPDSGGPVDAYLGIDVGSATTKMALVRFAGSPSGQDDTLQVVAKTYLPTAGKPLAALKKGLEIIHAQAGERVRVRGVGSTGSGRYLCGGFVGADVVRNEITAQATAAGLIDPEVDTIFEIGGQDSKYIRMDKGAIVDFAMNKVCAAGTGSFLEEQSVRLGIDVRDFGELALSASAPVQMGERCTVFMQSDLVHYQQRGVSKPDLAAGLCYSIVANYLNKVVEQGRVGGKILFQGGTALNEGIVAAFEQVLGKPVVVPPHNEVTGAIGAAILAAREHEGASEFKGFDLHSRAFESRIFECGGCTNNCEIQKIYIQGEETPLYFGHRCEKYERSGAGAAADSQPDLLRERQELLLSYCPSGEDDPGEQAPEIGIPRTLFFQEWLPFFAALLRSLGFRPVLSSPSSKKVVAKGSEAMVTETCLPIKAAHGHVLDLLDRGVQRVFLPQVCDFPPLWPEASPGKVCPYVQGIPWTIRSAIDFSARGAELLSPVLHLGGNKRVLERECREFARLLGVGKTRMKRGLEAAWRAQESFRSSLKERGREILSRVRQGEKAVLLVGRPYNAFDPGLNMDISMKLRKMGALAIPIDFLPLEDEPAGQDLEEMYWSYGQKILAAAYVLKRYENLYPVFLTNFSCGPDAFILHFFETLIGERPYLELEVDEHTADAGVVTRLEAFWNSVRDVGSRECGKAPFTRTGGGYRKDRILYLPPMTDHLHAFAGAFRSCGVDARVLPDSDSETLRLGRQHTKGKECLPAVLTTGDILKTVKREDFDPKRSTFFMPAARGPCRFGLYNQLHRLILEDLDMPEVPVYAPNQSYTLYEELGIVGRDFATLAWMGTVAVDILIKFLLETRPYARDKEECTRLYRWYLDAVSRSLERGGKDLEEIMSEASRSFRGMQAADAPPKPVVGIVGEIYVRSNPFANEFIVNKLEELGAEVWLPTIGEWIHYINFTGMRAAWQEGDRRRWLKMMLQSRIQHRKERRLVSRCNGWLRSLPEPEVKEILDSAEPYIDTRFEGEAILSVGKSLNYLSHDVRGLVNVIPFTCMPGGVVDALLGRIKSVRDIPMLTVSFDGQRETNTRNRLEAFMYQVQQGPGAVSDRGAG